MRTFLALLLLCACLPLIGCASDPDDHAGPYRGESSRDRDLRRDREDHSRRVEGSRR
jgi:hypothetical protein